MFAIVNAKTGALIEGGFFQFRFAEESAMDAAIEHQTDVQVKRQDNETRTAKGPALMTAVYNPPGP